MMSKVRSKGPAFLLRTRLVSSCRGVGFWRSFIVWLRGLLKSAFAEPEHFKRRSWFHDMLEVEAVKLAAIEMRRVVEEGDARDQPAPFLDRQVQGLMAHDGGERVHRLLLGREDFEDEHDLVALDHWCRFERAHSAVLAVNLDQHLPLLTGREHARCPPGHRLLQTRDPIVDLGDDERIADGANEDAFPAGAFDAFELDGIG